MSPSIPLCLVLLIGLLGSISSAKSTGRPKPNTVNTSTGTPRAEEFSVERLALELLDAEDMLDDYLNGRKVSRDTILKKYEVIQQAKRSLSNIQGKTAKELEKGQVMGFCMMFFTVSESITTQLETLEVSLSRIKFRAAHLARFDPKDPETEKTEEFRQALHLCFKHSIKHHQAIIRVFEDFKDICYISMLWLIVGLTFLLCLSAVLFTSDASIISKGVFASFLLTELLMTYLQCSYGEWFAGTSSDLPWDLYKSDWYTISRDMLIYHRMLTMRCTRPLQLSAGGFTKISKNTFLEVIKTAFSYTNLLQASNNRRVTSDDW